MQPDGFKAEDVYVCESRYAARIKSFKKIKIWAMPESSVKLVPRESPLPVVRVASMFAKPDLEKLTVSYIDSGSFVDKVRKVFSSCIHYTRMIFLFHRSYLTVTSFVYFSSEIWQRAKMNYLLLMDNINIELPLNHIACKM